VSTLLVVSGVEEMVEEMEQTDPLIPFLRLNPHCPHWETSLKLPSECSQWCHDVKYFTLMASQSTPMIRDS